MKSHFGDLPHEIGHYPHTSPVQAIWAIGGTIDTMDEGADEEDMQISSSSSARYLTGDREGLVAVWRLVHNKHSELRLKLLSLLDVSLLLPRPVNPSIRSISEREGTILLGTLSSEIFEVVDDNIPLLSAAFQALKIKRATQNSVLTPISATDTAQMMGKPQQLASSITSKGPLDLVPGQDRVNPRVSALRLISGHYQGELRGLAVHPSQPLYITCGDDGMLCCWSLVQHKLLSYMRLPEMLRAVDLHPINGSEVAVALNSGAVWIIRTNRLFNPRNVPQIEIDFSLSGVEIDITVAIDNARRLFNSTQLSQAHMNIIPTATATAAATTDRSPLERAGSKLLSDILILPKGATQWAQELKYSFEGSVLAVGSHDSNIYMYSVDNNYVPWNTESINGKGMKHSSFVTHIDFGVVLVPRPNETVTYDEINRKIVTSQLQVDKSVSTKSSKGHLESESKILPIIPFMTTNDDQERERERKKSKLVVTSTRNLCQSDICIQSTCGAGELLYWHLDGSRITSQELVKVRVVCCVGNNKTRVF